MKYSKIVAVLLTFIFLIGILSGCSTNPKGSVVGEDNSDQAMAMGGVVMGRYVEEDIPLPETMDGVGERMFQMVKNPEGKIVLSCRVVNAVAGQDGLTYTLNEDNTWIREFPLWLNQLDQPSWSNALLAFSPDGDRYALREFPIQGENRTEISIIKSTDGITARLAVALDNKFIAYAKRIRVLTNDRILLNGLGKCSIIKDGYEMAKFTHAISVCCAVSGNSLMLPNIRGDKVSIYNIYTSEIISEIELPNNIQIMNSEMTVDGNGNWYLVAASGIYRLAKNGNTWEQILDGSIGSMSDPSMKVRDITLGNDGDFYILYDNKLKHYVYYSDIPTFPSKTLTITSIENNATIKKAVFEYMNENPDVKVELNILKDPKSTAPISEYVEVVNSELLEGKGSDLYILDGMPIDSYVEKGALADLSDILNPMIEDGTLMENKIDCYRTDGKLYYAPIRFGIEIVYGKRVAVETTGDLASLSDYAANRAQIEMLGNGIYSYKDLISLLYENYSDELLDSDGAFKKEELTLFLERMKKISDQSKAVETVMYPNNTEGVLGSAVFGLTRTRWVLVELKFIELINIRDIYDPMKVIELTDGDWARVNDGEFIPYGLIGINNASPNKDIAAGFIKKCYSESIQELNLSDGFPVNSKELNEIETAKDDYKVYMQKYTAEQPSQEIMKMIMDFAKSSDTPVSSDAVFLDILIKEIEPYLEGRVVLKSTVDSIIEKRKLYLAE